MNKAVLTDSEIRLSSRLPLTGYTSLDISEQIQLGEPSSSESEFYSQDLSDILSLADNSSRRMSHKILTPESQKNNTRRKSWKGLFQGQSHINPKSHSFGVSSSNQPSLISSMGHIDGNGEYDIDDLLSIYLKPVEEENRKSKKIDIDLMLNSSLDSIKGIMKPPSPIEKAKGNSLDEINFIKVAQKPEKTKKQNPSFKSSSYLALSLPRVDSEEYFQDYLPVLQNENSDRDFDNMIASCSYTGSCSHTTETMPLNSSFKKYFSRKSSLVPNKDSSSNGELKIESEKTEISTQDISQVLQIGNNEKRLTQKPEMAYSTILHRDGVSIDIEQLLKMADSNEARCAFVGGSGVYSDRTEKLVKNPHGRSLSLTDSSAKFTENKRFSAVDQFKAVDFDELIAWGKANK